jgi:ERCC4-type nuclease
MLTLVVDDREKNAFTFQAVLSFYSKPPKFSTLRSRLDVGDYSFLEDAGNTGNAAVERKSLCDLYSTFSTKNRERFMDEMAKLARMQTRAVVIEATMHDVLIKRPKFSRLNAHSLLGTIAAWQTLFNVPFVFAGNRALAEIFTFMLLHKAWKLYQSRKC